MSGSVKAQIFRFNPDDDREPHFHEYEVTLDGPTTALRLLDRIYQEQDNTLGFRNYCCGLQMCRSCLMNINQKKKFACHTLVQPGETLVIEPLTFPEGHVKDLVVKMEE